MGKAYFPGDHRSVGLFHGNWIGLAYASLMSRIPKLPALSCSLSVSELPS